MQDAEYDLPFDQYSRQEIARKIVNDAIRPFVKKSQQRDKLRIVDFGGHKGHTQDFFPQDNVVVLDVFDEVYDNYVKGDATRAPFKDNEFDIVVSFDTLEHIPKDKREKFVSEAARIAEYAFIVAAPFDNANHDISNAENIANELYKKINGVDHPWLAEHISYGIPTKKTTEEYIKTTGCDFIATPTNDLFTWMIAQGLMFNATAVSGDVKEVVDVSRFYNMNLKKLESMNGETYRQIYTCSKHPELLKEVDKAWPREKQSKDTATQTEYLGIINHAYSAVVGQLKKDTEYLKAREDHLQKKYDEAVGLAELLQIEVTNLNSTIERMDRSKYIKIINKLRRVKRINKPN